MKVYEFGKEHARSFVMFQCAVEPWWVFRASAEEMAKDYHVYLFIADGHDELGTEFVSLEKYAKDAAEYLKTQGIERVDAMYGVSMGGAAVIRFLATENIPVERAIIDAGITPYPYPGLICRLISIKDWIMIMLATRSLRMMKLACPPERWTPEGEDPEEHYRTLLKFYKQHYSPRTIYNVFWSTDNYSMPDPVPQVDTRIEYWYGEEEKRAREKEHDIEFICRTYPQTVLKEFKGLAHAELVMMFPERFAAEAKRFLEEEREYGDKSDAMKYHIEKNTVQETLVIPLLGRLVCSEHFPELFSDPEAKRICDSLDYDFAEKRKKMESAAGLFGALEVAQRQYDLRCEVERYLKKHPKAAVVNLGCGLDDTFSKVDNGVCRGYNIDLPDVIKVRNDLLPAGERETNLACDLKHYNWMDKINAADGAVFFAAGVFYYFRTTDVKRLFQSMAKHFPSGVLAFDSCNERGARLMRKTWLKEAGITDVGTLFSLEDESELAGWSDRFGSVTAKSYMRGYRDIYSSVGKFHKLMIRFCDRLVRMKIVRIEFRA